MKEVQKSPSLCKRCQSVNLILILLRKNMRKVFFLHVILRAVVN